MVDAFEYILPSVTTRHGGVHHFNSFDWNEYLISRHFWILVGLLFVIPISFFKTLNALRCASGLSLIIIYGLVGMVVLYAQGLFDPCFGYNNNINATLVDPTEPNSIEYLLTLEENPSNNSTSSDEVCHGETILIGSFTQNIQNLAVFVFSFTCHQNIFSVVNEISNRSQSRINIVIATAIISALILYFVISIEGYRTYGSEVKGDIILNYPQTLPVSLMRMSIAFMVMLSYPLQLDPSRRCITSLIHSCGEWLQHMERRRWQKINREIEEEIKQEIQKDNLVIDGIDTDFGSSNHNDLDQTNDNNEHLSPEEVQDLIEERLILESFSKDFIFNTVTCCFLILSFSIAMVVSDLGIILAIVGATGSTTVTYILPGLVYLKLHPHWHFMKLVASLQLLLGLIIIPSALYFVIFGNVRE